MANTNDNVDAVIENIYKDVHPFLNERQKRILAGSIAEACGFGGIKKVCAISGLDYKTVKSGISDKINKPEQWNEYTDEYTSENGIRRKGAGRPGIEKKYPEITEKVKFILENNTFGNPEQVLVWTNLSLRQIVQVLDSEYNIKTNKNVISDILEELGYSKQVNQKMEQVGNQHPNRDEQFKHINNKAQEFIAAGLPVISVDTKKKELIGNFKNNGQEYRPCKNPRKVLDHDFPLEGGKVSPYGIYVINNNTAYVNLGTSCDTGAFAVESIRRWWNIVGKATFPKADKLYVNCDGGGSNGSRVKLWKYALALLADELGIEIHVSHFPPGTSKWNKVEHKLFCYISRNWQGKPLIDIETTVNLIRSTKTKQGLTVLCEVDENTYSKGVKIEDDVFEKINLEKDANLPNWNYIIRGLKIGNK